MLLPPYLVASSVPLYVCVVLGCVIIWKVSGALVCFNGKIHYTPPALIQRMLSVYNDLGDCYALESKENSITVFPMRVTNINTQLIGDIII